MNAKRVGFAGPELVDQFAEVKEVLPDAPWLVVLRNYEDSIASFKAWSKPKLQDVPGSDEAIEKVFRERRDKLAHLCIYSNVMTISYEDLGKENAMRLVWAHLLAGYPFDVERFKLLQKLNVQQHTD